MSFNSFQNYELENFGYLRLPEVKIADHYKTNLGLDVTCSNYQFLEALCKRAYIEKEPQFNKEKYNLYKQQLDMELQMVKELDFVDYFLLVWMVINKAHELGAFSDYGRGSAAASIIFWLIGVTGVDPIDKELIFSRFISKVRAKKKIVNNIVYIKGDLAPDVDINLGGIRDEIVDWLKQIYSGRIAKIANLSTYTGKMLIKDVTKTVDNTSEEDAKDVADLVEKHAGIVEDIGAMVDKSEDFKNWTLKHPKAFTCALKLRDIIKQKSSHASGYLIAFEPLEGHVPLELNKEKELTVSYNKDDSANFSIKLDLLGLISDEIINDILKQIPEKAKDIELDTNPIVYDQFSNGQLLPYGLYQISADFARRVVLRIKPKNILELSDVNAIARPGALAYLDAYADNTAQPIHEAFRDILKKTRNVCLYQEQMMQMAMTVGFTAEESEQLRRVVGKKKVDEVKLWKNRIYENCEKNGFSQEVGDALWKILDDSSKYSFNLSHSVATAYLTALTVYLKYKYPLYFYMACLKVANKMPKPVDEIRSIARELPYFGIQLLPPHLTKSEFGFKIEDGNIRFGLSAIKGVSDKTMDKITKFKKTYSNKFEIFLGANQAGLSIGTLSALIQAGALEGFESRRSRIVLEAQTWNILTDREKEMAIQFGSQFDYKLIEIIKHLSTTLNERGKPLIRPSRFETIKKKYEPFKQIFLQNGKDEEFASWYYERELLGYSHNRTLYQIFVKNFRDIMPLSEALESQADEDVEFVGIVESSVSKVSKNGNRYYKMNIIDEFDNMIFVFLFKDDIEDCKEFNGGHLPVEKNIVAIRGRKKDDRTVFARHVSIQDKRIYMKLSEVRSSETE